MKKRKIISMIIIFILISTFFIPVTLASTNLGLDDLNSYKGNNENSTQLTTKAGNVLGYIQIIGIVISVAILIIIGIRYMLSSVEERAEYKKTFLLYILGAFLIFTGTTLPQLIYTFAQNF